MWWEKLKFMCRSFIIFHEFFFLKTCVEKSSVCLSHCKRTFSGEVSRTAGNSTWSRWREEELSSLEGFVRFWINGREDLISQLRTLQIPGRDVPLSSLWLLCFHATFSATYSQYLFPNPSPHLFFFGWGQILAACCVKKPPFCAALSSFLLLLSVASFDFDPVICLVLQWAVCSPPPLQPLKRARPWL